MPKPKTTVPTATVPVPPLLPAPPPRPKVELPPLGKLELEGASIDLDYFLKTEYVDAAAACAEFPALLEWINSQMQFYVENKIIAKQEIAQAEAACFVDMRNGGFERAGYAGKPTADAVDRVIQLDGGVIKAHTNYARYAGWVSKLSGLMNNIQIKLDLLRTSEATRRRMIEETRPET